MPEKLRLLIVCLGNICRSPMAEGIVRARLRAEGLADRVELDSAGTGDWHVGCEPDRRAIETAAERGVNIAGLRGRQFTPEDFERFDWILCADRQNLRDVRALAPDDASRERAALLLEWTGVAGASEIPDPYTGGPKHFQEVWSMLEQAADGVVRRLQ
ncbi:MAG: low molecular weight protein-tyrosine-phosphatase [Lysobacter spongiicola]|nr:low molecular weight protein-tyrosine-phosphatase [Lysobacter spongiicola]